MAEVLKMGLMGALNRPTVGYVDLEHPLMVMIYRSPLGDSTARGVTSPHRSEVIAYVVPARWRREEIDAWEAKHFPEGRRPNKPLLQLVFRGGQYPPICRPVEAGPSDWTMWGGNWVYTSDSRWPYWHPISVHDRIER